MIRRYKRKKGKSISQAKKHRYKGVQYRSGLEVKMARVLTELHIPFQYEAVKYELQKGFMFENDAYERQANSKGEYKNRGNKKILPITYTPDFTGEGWIIETKGYANESFPMKWKMFKDLIKNDKVTLFKPQCHKECELTGELILKLNK
jgi:hypothetical protein